MPVVLDNDPGERVLLYGADGSTLRKVVVDSSGQLVVVGPGAGGASVVTATDLDIRNLSKSLDELYAVLRTDAGVAYDARTRSWTITETVPVTATDLDIRNLSKSLDELYAVLRTDAGVAYDARTRSWTITEDVSVVQDAPADLKAAVHGIDGSTQRQFKVDSTARQVAVPEWDSHAEGSYDATVGNHADTTRFDVTLATTTAGRLISLFMWIDALTTNQAAFSYVTLDPQGAGIGDQILALVFGATTGITTVTMFPNIDLRPGDRLTGHTSNSDGSNRRFIVRATWLLRTI